MAKRKDGKKDCTGMSRQEKIDALLSDVGEVLALYKEDDCELVVFVAAAPKPGGDTHSMAVSFSDASMDILCASLDLATNKEDSVFAPCMDKFMRDMTSGLIASLASSITGAASDVASTIEEVAKDVAEGGTLETPAPTKH